MLSFIAYTNNSNVVDSRAPVSLIQYPRFNVAPKNWKLNK
jgi:hypothetical protein